MGASAGVMTPQQGSFTPEQELFAFKVVHYDMKHGALAIKLSSDNPNKLSDAQLFNRIQQTWAAAVKEVDTPYIECLNPAVIIYKHSFLSEQEVHDINETIVKELQSRDKAEFRAKKKAAASDYSQSFGGTAEDTKNEKDAAEILRGGVEGEEGTSEATKAYVSPYLTPPAILHQSERLALRQHGKWVRFFSALGLYMYFNTLSHELHSNRPEEYVEEADPNQGQQQADSTFDPTNGLPIVNTPDLPTEVERIVKELRKTPLLLDTSANQVARTFFTYKGCLEDVSSLTIPFGKSGVKREEIMERCRKRLVAAMKSGTPFVLYLGEVSIDHADFKTKLCKKDVFPKDVFTRGGQPLIDDADKRRLIYREEDLEHGDAVVRDGFFVIVISTLSPHTFEKQLADSVPLGYMHPVYVREE